MNTISERCRTLNVRHGATYEEVKTAYRDLVQVWHPDRFAGNERLQVTAQEKLKEINLAWEYLSANAFHDGVLVEPEEAALSNPDGVADDRDSATGSDSASRPAKWPWVFGVVVLVIAAAFVLFRAITHHAMLKAQVIPAVNSAPVLPISKSNELAQRAEPRVFPFVTNVLAGSGRTNASSSYLEFPPLLEPPFAVRVDATLKGLDEFHLHYAMGQIVFNWSPHLQDLFIISPQAAINTTVANEGILLPGSKHSILWIVRSNSMEVEVDDKTRFQTNDNFSGLKGRVSVQSFAGTYDFAAFEVQTPQDPFQADTAPSARTIFRDDILPTMIPEANLTERSRPEGVTIQTADDRASRLMTAQSFHPPFTIRTCAKTDALNLRLFCENGMIIFNWELNSRELRVHDPLTGEGTPIANEGFVLPNEWHDFSWSIQPMGMTLTVDGKARFQNHRDYRAVNGKVGIAPYKSEVTIDYFAVEKK